MRALLRVPKRLVHQKLPHGSILTQYNGALVCRRRILASLHAREKVRGERPIRLITSDRFWRNRAEHSPSCPGAARFPAAGKTTFYRRYFAATHRHVSKDLWPNARRRDARQREVFHEALDRGESVVIDNTSATWTGGTPSTPPRTPSP